MDSSVSRLAAFLSELRRRRVVRAAVVYAAAAFVVVQAADIIFPALHLPGWTLTFVVVLALLGFPVAVGLGWAFEVTPEGVRRTGPAPVRAADADGNPPARPMPVPPVRRITLAAIVVGLLLVAGYAWRTGRAADPVLPDGPVRALAVLPLDNLSGDPDQEFFVDGMTEALIAELSRIGALKVISRTSIMRFKGTREPLPEIARMLDVDGLIEGSVLRAGDRVRITVQFVHGPTDRHLWADHYEGDLSDIIGLQGEVARSIAREIRARVTPEERERLARGQRSADPAAYDAYLKGRYELARFTAPAARRAVEHFQESIRLDPTYAPAHASLGQAYAYLSQPLGGMASQEGFPLARAAAARALELDPSLSKAHMAMGMVQFLHDWDWRAAEASNRRAVELDPGSADALRGLGIFLGATHRSREEATRIVERTLELDPLALQTRVWACELLQYVAAYEQANAHCLHALDLDPTFARAWLLLQLGYEGLGQYEDAIDTWAEWRLRADTTQAARQEVESLRAAYGAGGSQGYWQWFYDRGSRAERVLIGLGRLDELMSRLEALEEGRSGMLAFLRLPLFDPVRAEPRFQELLGRMRLD